MMKTELAQTLAGHCAPHRTEYWAKAIARGRARARSEPDAEQHLKTYRDRLLRQGYNKQDAVLLAHAAFGNRP
jgi:hypothetical protein